MPGFPTGPSLLWGGGGGSPYGRGSIVLRWGQVFVVGVFREALKFQCICASYFTYWHWSGLNISTGHRTMAGKKSSYFLRKLLHIGHICAALSFFLSYWRLKTHRHLVSMFLFYSDFSLYEHFIRQMTYAVVLYSKLRDVWRKRFYTNPLLFSCPAWDNFSENIYISIIK